MNPGDVLSLRKKGPFRDAWEIANVHGGRVGLFSLVRRFVYPRASGEAGGRTFTFVFASWASSRTEVHDEWGRTVGTMHREGWLAPRSQLILHEKEYVWHSSRLGESFCIELTDGTPLITVSGCGGFGTVGHVAFSEALEHTEALSLIYMGLYQTRTYEAEVAVSTLLIPALLACARLLLT